MEKCEKYVFNINLLYCLLFIHFHWLMLIYINVNLYSLEYYVEINFNLDL